MTTSVLEIARRFLAERTAHPTEASDSLIGTAQTLVPRDTPRACPMGHFSKALLPTSAGTNGTLGTGGTPDINVRADLGKSAPRDHIAAALDRLPRPCNRPGQRLLRCSRDFLFSPLFETATRLGWSKIELFGIAPALGRAPIGAWGLVPTLASVMEPGWRIVTVTETGAMLTNDNQRQAIWPRSQLNEWCVVWWECDDLIGDFDE
jgi:hypothetical protein